MPVSISGSGQVIVQVKQTVLNTAFATSSTSYADITGLSVSITPTSASNRILVLLNVQGAANDYASFRLVRNSTPIGVGVPSGVQNATTLNQFYVTNQFQSFSGGVTFIDSPATTSATTYKVQGFTQSTQLVVNGNYNNSNSTAVMTSISTITVMEISGT